jgi:hypothetical protein
MQKSTRMNRRIARQNMEIFHKENQEVSHPQLEGILQPLEKSQTLKP